MVTAQNQDFGARGRQKRLRHRLDADFDAVLPGLSGMRIEIEMVEPGQNDKGFVSAIAGASPAVTNSRVEKVCHQTVRVVGGGKLRFQHASPLEFGKTFQFVAGKSAEKIQNAGAITRNCVAKKSTEQRRPRGDSGQC